MNSPAFSSADRVDSIAFLPRISLFPTGQCRTLAAALAVASAVAAHAQMFEYGRGYVISSGGFLTGEPSGPGMIGSAGHDERANGVNGIDVPGMSQYAFAYANPAGGSVSVNLDVPGSAMRSYNQAPPQVWAWDPAINNYRGQSGYGLAWVGFQDKITIQGPSLAAYQSIPITMILHLDGSLTAGTGGGTSGAGNAGVWDYAEVRLRGSLQGAAGTSGIGVINGSGSLNFDNTLHSGASATYNQDFVFQGNFAPTTAGGLISMWLNIDLTTWTGNGGVADFGNTASVELVLPEGYTYTSTMNFASEVPEPTHAALVGSFGVLGLGLWRWLRPKRSVSR